MATATKTKAQDTQEALDWLEEDANQLRVTGHGSLEREGKLVVLRQAIDKIGNSKLRPREGQPWPVTAGAGSYANDEYAQPTAMNGIPNDTGYIEGDPHRDAKTVRAQLKVERERAELNGAD